MGNIWKKLNKLNKSTYEISKETNIPEDKVKEIMAGKRELPKERIDKFVEALQKDDKVEKSLKLHEVKKWYEETDLKARRKELGYKTQKDLAKALELDNSCICRLENKQKHGLSDETLIRYYDFMVDGLNTVISNKQKTKYKKSLKIPKNISEKEREEIINTNWKDVEKFYKEFDFKKWFKQNRMTHKDLAKILGYKSSSSVTDTINRRDNLNHSRVPAIRIYLYITKLEEEKTKDLERQLTMYDNMIKKETQPIEEDIEILDETCEANITDEIIEEPTVEEMKSSIRKDYNNWIEENKDATIMRLEYELEEARKQIARYEKLIDMIIVKE